MQSVVIIISFLNHNPLVLFVIIFFFFYKFYYKRAHIPSLPSNGLNKNPTRESTGHLQKSLGYDTKKC